MSANDLNGGREPLFLETIPGQASQLTRADGTRLGAPVTVTSTSDGVAAASNAGVGFVAAPLLRQAIRPEGVLLSSSSAVKLPVRSQIGFLQKLARLKAGAVEQFGLGFIGDSWFQDPKRGISGIAKALHSEYGFGGNGYTAFSWPAGGNTFGTARPDLYSVTLTGTWTSNHYGQSLPSMGRIESSTIGDKVSVTYPAGHTSAKLYYSGSAGSAVRYRWDGGSWTTLSLASGSPATLSGMPLTAGLLEIEVTAGAVKMGGVDLKKSDAGIVLHNLGASGSTSSQWAGLNGAAWATATANLGIGGYVILLGANDLSNDRPPADFVGFIQTLVTNIRIATPGAPILFVSQPICPIHADNLARLYTRTQYLTALAAAAPAMGIDIYDLQPAFGDDVTFYRAGGTFPLISADAVHVADWGMGATVVAREILNALHTI